MILLLVVISLLPALCACCTDGMKCNGSDVVDGTCVRGTCLASIPSLPRENLTFTIVVKYPEDTLKAHGGSRLFVRGSGLGLRWDTGTVLPKTSAGEYRLPVLYTSTPAGYRCQACADKRLLVGEKLEYRVLIDDRQDMLGANFAVKLPVSKVSSYFSSNPEFFSYPWFFQKTGNLSATVIHNTPLGGDRSIAIYKPPSFYENVYKSYPVLLALDFDGKTLNVPLHLFDDPIVKYGVSREFIVIGFGDYSLAERLYFLTPSEHIDFECKNGSLLDRCDGCFPADYFKDMNAWLKLMVNKCARFAPVGGAGNAVIEFLLGKVIPIVQSLVSGRLDTARENVGIVGYSLGGLMACHAAWTRPRDLGFAACQSSSFWWPLIFKNDSVTSGFEFLNQTMVNATLNADRPRQRIYIDVGDQESDRTFRMINAAVEVADKMSRMAGFELDLNVWVNVYQGSTHSFLEWMMRMWKVLKTLLPAPGMPAMPVVAAPSPVG